MNCRICDKEIKMSFASKVRTMMSSRKMCFYCNYWQNRIERIGNPSQIIIKGNVYQNAGDKPGKTERDVGFMGFGGRRFTWRMLETGEIQTSNDLWSNGKPEHPYFQALLHDNAEWIKEKEHETNQ